MSFDLGDLVAHIKAVDDNFSDKMDAAVRAAKKAALGSEAAWTEVAGKFSAAKARFAQAGEEAGSSAVNGIQQGMSMRQGALASFIGNLAAQAAAQLGQIAIKGVELGISVASQMETANIAFTTMLGSGEKAGAFIKQLSAFAAATPFDFPGLQTAASSLLSIGIDTSKIIPIMTTLGNVTSGMGTGAEGIKRATVALQQMNAAGKIQAQDLNQLRDAGIPVYDLLAAAMGKPKAEIAELANQGKLGKDALDAMMKALETGKGLEKFNGLMEKQSASLAGLWSTFKDNLGMGLAHAFDPILPGLKVGLGAAASFLGDVAMPGLAAGLGWFMAKGGEVVAWIRSSGIPEAAASIASGVSAGFGVIQGAVASLVSGFQSGTGPGGEIRDILGGVWSVIKALGDGLAGLDVPGKFRMLTFEWQLGTGVGGELRDATNNVLTVFGNLGSFMTTTLVPAVQNVIKWIGDNKTLLEDVAIVIGVILLPAFVTMGVTATAQAAVVVAAWVAGKAEAITSAASQLASSYVTIGGWIASGAAAIASGAETVAIWLMLKADAIAGAASVVASHAAVVVGWASAAAGAVVSGLTQLGVWAEQGIQAAIGAGRVVLGFGTVIAGWASTAVAAVAAGATQLAVWIEQGIQAGLGAGRVILGFLVVAGGWIATAATAMASGVIMAAAWLVGLGPIGWIIAAIIAVVGVFLVLYNNVGWFRDAVNVVWAAIVAGVKWLVDFVIALFMSQVNFILSIPGRINAFASGVMGVWRQIQSGVNQVGQWISDAWNGVISFFTSIPGRITSALGNVGNLLKNAGSGIINGFLNGLRDAWSQVTNFVGGIAGWIAAHKGPLSYDYTLLQPAGTIIMKGFGDALVGGIPDLKGKLDQVTATVAGTNGYLNASFSAAGYSSAKSMPESITLRDSDGTFIARMQTEARGAVESDWSTGTTFARKEGASL